MSFIFACVGRRMDWVFARRVVDVWEQLRSVALRAARGRRVVARALPKGLQQARAADFATVFWLRRPHGNQGAPRQRDLQCRRRCCTVWVCHDLGLGLAVFGVAR